VKVFPLGLCCAGLFILAGLVAGVSEVMGAWLGAAARISSYLGGAAGLLIVLAGIPFMVKLGSISLRKDGAHFWGWWGAGALVRVALLVPLAIVLAFKLSDTALVALMVMAGVYLLGMFAESAYVAWLCFAQNARRTADAAGTPALDNAVRKASE
jgi:hypothetical protein